MTQRIDPKLPIAPVGGDDPAVKMFLPQSFFDRLLRRLNELFYQYSGAAFSPLTTKGDIWGFDTADDRIPVGSDGQVLTADSTAALGVSYKTVSSGTASPLTTKGDVWGYDTTNDRIPVGTNGQVLTANSAAALGVDWETPAAGGSQQPLYVYFA